MTCLQVIRTPSANATHECSSQRPTALQGQIHYNRTAFFSSSGYVTTKPQEQKVIEAHGLQIAQEDERRTAGTLRRLKMAWRRLPRAEIRCPTGSIPILHLDRHVVVVNKPGGCPSQGDKSLAPDVLTLTQATLQSILNKPKVFLGLVHRLDRNTSGAQLMCLTSKAARRLSEQLRERTTVKVYLTVATGSVKQRALWRDTVVTGLSGNVTRVTKGGSEGQEAVMEVLPLAEAMHQHGGPQTLLAVRLVTGRKHQIRAQLSSRGHPIVGDVKYGSASAFRDRSLALHCWRFGWKQPIGGEQVWVEAPWPESWEARFKGLLDKSPLRLRRKGDGQLGPWEELLA